MNELIIGGILLFIFGILCLVIDFVENFGKRWEHFKDWLFDLGTAYYKFKFNRQRKKNKQYFNYKEI